MTKKIFWCLGLMAALCACQPQSQSSSNNNQTMMINGAGATFPAPIYTRWAADYHQLSGIAVNYQGVGSSAGVDAIKKQTVDFGATDMPLSADDLNSANLIQFPAIIGGVVPVYHLDGIQNLVLDGAVLGDIYAMKITRWSDPKIAALNPDIALPDNDIKVVRRSDSSGTSYMFSEYLTQVNDTWKTMGASKDPQWAQGTVGGKGNDGVAAAVKQLPDSIGYVEYAYAQKNGMTSASLINKSGKTVAPTVESFAAAAAQWDEASGMGASLNNQADENAWPITGATFILLSKTSNDSARTTEILKFFDWAFTSGKQQALDLEYIPLPENLVHIIKNQWHNIKTPEGQIVLP